MILKVTCAAVRLFLFALMTVSLELAQSSNGSIAGQVMDPSRAVIAQALVSAVNTNTNFLYETETNEAGTYLLATLAPGNYRVEIEKTGFKSAVRPNVVLHVQDALELNFELAVGSMSDTVTVESSVLAANTQYTTVSTVVNRQFIENIPLNGRSFQSLLLLTPGVVATKATFAEQGQFSINGQRADANYYTVDGVSANFGINAGGGAGQAGGGLLPALNASGGFNNLVSVDALQEFRIQTSTYAPEYGRTPGGQISLVTRSGTQRQPRLSVRLPSQRRARRKQPVCQP